MVRSSYQLPAISYRPGLDVEEGMVYCHPSALGDDARLSWELVAGSWRLRYNRGLQRLSGRRSCPARGSNVHLTPKGSDAVLRGGNEPVRNPVFCVSVA